MAIRAQTQCHKLPVDLALPKEVPPGAELLAALRGWASELGFSQIGVADVDLSAAEPGLVAWLEAGFHGGMHYMQAHGLKRARPAELQPGTVRVITARMDYLPRELLGAQPSSGARLRPEGAPNALASGGSGAEQGAEPPDWRDAQWQAQGQPQAAVVSVYARGRDYHKVLRQRLQKLAERLAQAVWPLGHRVFTDSAPVLEVELATRSGLGWRGKHTLALSREAGSMYFLGEIFVDCDLPLTEPQSAHCGSCERCLQACPTQAIVAPYRLDARRCISYLTIEHEGPIPLEFRAAMGNRIYGCDDCQLACPWNKFAQRSTLPDFDVREPFSAPTLLTLWDWSEAEFLSHTEGSAIRRIGHARWQRNLAVAMGNALASPLLDDPVKDALRTALQGRQASASALLREHIDWALAQGSA